MMSNAQLISVDRLSSSQREAMYVLLSTHFEGVKLAVFEADLHEKNWVILIEQNGVLKGFSTLLIYETEFARERLSVVYSGDTIMDPTAWSSSTLSKAWIASVRQLRQFYSQGKLYWLLISSGYRTYRFLPIFWKEFYPRYDVKTPEYFETLMKFLARDRFGESYNVSTGIVRLSHPQVLQVELRHIPPERFKDPHIRFFNLRNPGHMQGDELVCLAEICEDNLTSAGRRMWYSNFQPAMEMKAAIPDREDFANTTKRPPEASAVPHPLSAV